MSRSVRCVALLAVGAIGLTACTRPENAETSATSVSPPPSSVPTETTTATTTDSETTVPSSVVPATSEPSATTSTTPSPTTMPSSVAPTTTPAGATTSTAAPRADLTLIFDGVVPYLFGDRDVDVVPAFAELLGAPVRDESAEYPDAVEGLFVDESGELSYIAPFGRTVCYADSLCVQFGAGAPETLLFSGWSVDSAASGLTTDDGIEIGSTLEEHADVIDFDPLNSCFTIGYADAGGIDVVLSSSDGAFAVPSDDEGSENMVAADVDPALVTVIEMRAGRLPASLTGDC